MDGGGGKLTGVIIYNGESATVLLLFGNFVLFYTVCENLAALADPSRVRDSRG